MKLKMFGALLVASLMSPIVMKAAAADVIKEPEWGPVEEGESYTVGPGIKYTKYLSRQTCHSVVHRDRPYKSLQQD